MYIYLHDPPLAPLVQMGTLTSDAGHQSTTWLLKNGHKTQILIIKFRKGFNLKRAWLKFQKLSPQKKSHLYSWSLRSRLTPNPTRPIRRLPARGVKRSKCSDSTIINEWLPPRRLGMTIGHIETVLSKKQNGISTNDPRYSVWYVHYIFVRTPSTKVDSDSFFTNFCRNLMFHVYISQNLDDLHWKPPSPSIFQACTLHFNTLNLSWIQVIE